MMKMEEEEEEAERKKAHDIYKYKYGPFGRKNLA